jgi:hypothetical protein
LEGLFSDVAGKDSLILETVETLKTEDFLCNGVHFSGLGHDLILICFFVHFHFKVGGTGWILWFGVKEG